MYRCCFRDRLFGSSLKMYSCYFTLGQCAINQYSCVCIFLGWSFMDLQYTMTLIIIFLISCRLELQEASVFTYCIRYFMDNGPVYFTDGVLSIYSTTVTTNCNNISPFSSYSLFYDLLQSHLYHFRYMYYVVYHIFCLFQ